MRWIALVCVLAGCAIGEAAPAEQMLSTEVPRSRRVLEVGVHEGVPWPIINAPIDGPLPPAPVPSAPPPAAATKAGARVLALIDEIRVTMVASKYQAATSVRVKDGIYNWDCSGMAAWILRRTAPVAQQTLASSRPVARDFVAAIERAPIGKSRGG